jgi:hypothetical protein
MGIETSRNACFKEHGISELFQLGGGRMRIHASWFHLALMLVVPSLFLLLCLPRWAAFQSTNPAPGESYPFSREIPAGAPPAVNEFTAGRPLLLDPLAKVNGTYKYYQMVTNDYIYRGFSVNVAIPAEVDLNEKTVQNLYNTHLMTGSGHWVEAGVGWVSWANGPIIYVYESYHAKWTYEKIPDGEEREIYLRLEINADMTATMYAFDPLSGKSVSKTQEVEQLNHRVDQTQEQFSSYNAWTKTDVADYSDSKIKTAEGEWINWDDAVDSYWKNDVPLYGTHRIRYSTAWLQTWCMPEEGQQP